MTSHVVMYSGGLGSWLTATRVAETRVQTGDQLVLVFADTLMEDEDLYRFLKQTADQIEQLVSDVELVTLTEGRDVWQVFHDEKYIGNTRIDPCSRILKRQLIRRYVDEHFTPEDTVVYLGIDWSEQHRFEKARPYWSPYQVQAPLCERPFVDRDFALRRLKDLGIAPPRLYAMGFAHNNCGGFCVKAGQGAFKTLLEQMPERYDYHAKQEQLFRETTGKDVAILRDRRGGTTKPLTLVALRDRVNAGGPVDELDVGGCACFTPDDYDHDQDR